MAVDIYVQNFVNGHFTTPGLYLDSYNPATGRVWAKIPDSDWQDVEMAVKAAKMAFPLWSNMPAEKRSQIMLKIADILESRLEEFAQAESRDQGKPVSLARAVDIPRAVHNFRFFATSVLHHLDTSSYLGQTDALNYTCRTPVGVTGLISPWNLPMYLLTFKIAPAIATGNTVVAKPSEFTSVTAWMLCSVLRAAGLPAGVVNMVFGTGPKVGEALVRHPDVPLISFTGSTATATRIRHACEDRTKKLSLELGGKNAAIVFDDVNLDACMEDTIRSSFTNQGEICLCTSRIFVQRGIFKQFVDRFVEKTRNIKVGDPCDPTAKMGALVSVEHLNKVRRYVKIAEAEHDEILCGEGKDHLNLRTENARGYFFAPTVITGMSDDSPLMQEEIFGPVVCITLFDTEEEVINRVNNTQYGLCASVWTHNVGTMHRVAKRLQVGTVWGNCWLVRDLNMPFGGSKESGLGREGFEHSIDFFTEVKTVCVKI